MAKYYSKAFGLMCTCRCSFSIAAITRAANPVGWNSAGVSWWHASEVQGGMVSQVQNQGLSRFFSGSSGRNLLPGSSRWLAKSNFLQFLKWGPHFLVGCWLLAGGGLVVLSFWRPPHSLICSPFPSPAELATSGYQALSPHLPSSVCSLSSHMSWTDWLFCFQESWDDTRPGRIIQDHFPTVKVRD